VEITSGYIPVLYTNLDRFATYQSSESTLKQFIFRISILDTETTSNLVPKIYSRSTLLTALQCLNSTNGYQDCPIYNR
jgi:hypothetical protein